MLDVIFMGRIVARRRNLKDGDGALERLARAEILVSLSRLQDARVAGLMTRHADVVRKLAAQALRVHDRRVGAVLGEYCPVGEGRDRDEMLRELYPHWAGRIEAVA